FAAEDQQAVLRGLGLVDRFLGDGAVDRGQIDARGQRRCQKQREDCAWEPRGLHVNDPPLSWDQHDPPLRLREAFVTIDGLMPARPTVLWWRASAPHPIRARQRALNRPSADQTQICLSTISARGDTTASY